MLFLGYVYKGVERKMNYFGKSNWDIDALFDGCLDEIKIFDRALSQKKIQIEMNTLCEYSTDFGPL
jgi:hypothetical protein